MLSYRYFVFLQCVYTYTVALKQITITTTDGTSYLVSAEVTEGSPDSLGRLTVKEAILSAKKTFFFRSTLTKSTLLQSLYSDITQRRNFEFDHSPVSISLEDAPNAFRKVQVLMGSGDNILKLGTQGDNPLSLAMNLKLPQKAVGICTQFATLYLKEGDKLVEKADALCVPTEDTGAMDLSHDLSGVVLLQISDKHLKNSNLLWLDTRPVTGFVEYSGVVYGFSPVLMLSYKKIPDKCTYVQYFPKELDAFVKINTAVLQGYQELRGKTPEIWFTENTQVQSEDKSRTWIQSPSVWLGENCPQQMDLSTIHRKTKEGEAEWNLIKKLNVITLAGKNGTTKLTVLEYSGVLDVV